MFGVLLLLVFVSGGCGQFNFPAGVTYTCYRGGTCSGLTLTTSGVTSDLATLNPCCFANSNYSEPIDDGAYIADGSMCQKCATSQNVQLTFHKLTCYSNSRCDKHYNHYYGAASDHCYHGNDSARSDNDTTNYDYNGKHYSTPSYIFLYKFFVKHYKPYHHSRPSKPPPYYYYNYYDYHHDEDGPHKHPHGSGTSHDDYQYYDYGSGKGYDYHYNYGHPKGPPPFLHKLCYIFSKPHHHYDYQYGSGDDSSYNYNYHYHDDKHYHHKLPPSDYKYDYSDYGSGGDNYDNHHPPYKILQHSLKKLHYYKSHHSKNYHYDSSSEDMSHPSYDYNYDYKHSTKTPNDFFHYLYHYYYDYHPQGKCYYDYGSDGHHPPHNNHHYDYTYYDYHYYDYHYGHHKQPYKPKHKPANKFLQYILKKIHYYKSDSGVDNRSGSDNKPPSYSDYGPPSSGYDYHYPQYGQHHPGQSFYYLLSKVCHYHYKPPKKFGAGFGSGVTDYNYGSGQDSSYGGQDYHHHQPQHHKPPPYKILYYFLQKLHHYKSHDNASEYDYGYYDYGSGKSPSHKDYYDYGSGKPLPKSHYYHYYPYYKLLHYLKHLHYHYHYYDYHYYDYHDHHYDYGSGKSPTYKDYYDYGSGKPPSQGHYYHHPYYKILHYLKHLHYHYHYYDYQYYDYGSGKSPTYKDYYDYGSGKSPTYKDYYDYGSGKPPSKGHDYHHLYHIIHHYLQHLKHQYHYYDYHYYDYNSSHPSHDNKHAYYDYHYSYLPYNIMKYLKKKLYYYKHHQSGGLGSGQPPFFGSGSSSSPPPTKLKDHYYPPSHLPPYNFLYLFYKYYNKNHKPMQSNTFFSDGNMTEFNYCCSGKSTNQSYEIDGKQCIPCSLPSAPLTGADPHFTCPLRNGEMLCFNVQGEPDFIFNLISSKYINLNALFVKPADEESKSIDADSTFVSEVGLLVKSKHQNKPVKIKISAFDHSIDVLGSHTVITDSSITVKVCKEGKISIGTSASTANKENDAMLYVETEYGFAIIVRFLKKHLDMFITDNSGFTNDTHGILGQFMLDNIKIDEQYQLMKVGERQPFPVKKSEVWPFLHIPGECWYGTYTDHQAEGIIEGIYTDYITDDLFSNDFKYMFKAK